MKMSKVLTQIEWEYAARAAGGGESTTLYPWGDTITTSDARCGADSTAVCGSYPANNYGLYDMVGNVWEWCGNITEPATDTAVEKRGRASGSCGAAVTSSSLKLGYHRDIPSQGFVDDSYYSLGFRTVCRTY